MMDFEQYDDLKTYDLVEIVIAHKCKNKGIVAGFILELERRAKFD